MDVETSIGRTDSSPRIEKDPYLFYARSVDRTDFSKNEVSRTLVDDVRSIRLVRKMETFETTTTITYDMIRLR